MNLQNHTHRHTSTCIHIYTKIHTHTHSITKAYSHSRWHFSLLGIFYSCNIKFLRRKFCCVSPLVELIIPKSTCIPAQLSTSNSRSLLFKYMVAASAVVCEDKIVNIISIFSGHQGRTGRKGGHNSLCQLEQSPCGYYPSLTLMLSAFCLVFQLFQKKLTGKS